MSEMLLSRAKNGNKEAFGQLINPYERLIYNIAYKYMGNAEDAKDIAQESLIKIYLNIKTCRSAETFKAWAAKITVNTALDALRKHTGRTAEVPDDYAAAETDMPEHSVIRNERIKMITDAINSLSDEHRTLIILRDLEGFSYGELAQAAGITLGTVKSRLSRARYALREQIGKPDRHMDERGDKID